MQWNGRECGGEKNKVMRISRQPSSIQTKIDQIQQVDVEYFNYLGNLIIKDAKCSREITSRFAMAKAAFNKKTFHQQIGLNFVTFISGFILLVVKIVYLIDWQFCIAACRDRGLERVRR